LAWGTANAQTVTLSFWVRSSLTGTFSGALSNSAQDRNYPFTFTISTANTFEYKSVTIVGDTSGTWIGSTNGIGIRVKFNLGTGSTYLQTAGAWTASYANGATGSVALVNTNTATFYITGVQLEKGSTATSFDYRPISTELALCQRYFQSVIQQNYLPALCFSTNRVLSGVPFPGGPMRIAPSMSINATYFTFFTAGVAQNSTAISTTPYAAGHTTLDVTVTASAGASGVGSIGAYSLSAEL
jgi:hypothetical protein